MSPNATPAHPTSDTTSGQAPTADLTQTPTADLTKAPLPTARTLRMRRSLPVQAARFALINARMMRMVLKGHH